MTTTENQFRGVAFGGFNRQDVMTFLENTLVEHGRQVEALNKKLETIQEKCTEQDAALTQAETVKIKYAEDNSRLSDELAAAQRDLADKSSALSDAKRELVVLREKVIELSPGAEAYERIKNRAGTIELEAHLRAKTILDEAEAQANFARARVEEWLQKLQARYDRLRTDVDATVSHTSGELERIQRSLGGVIADFESYDDALTDIQHCCREAIPVTGIDAADNNKVSF